MLVQTAEAVGLRLEPRPGGILHVEPRGRLTPTLREALRAAKAEILSYLQARALGVDWSRVSLYQLDRVLAIAVPWADMPLILAPGCRVARELRAQDQRPGRVWCTCEVLDLLFSGVTPQDARTVGEVKLAMAGVLLGAQKGRP